ncbi:MAG: DUF427 domain-containing protein [Chloroflexi bacterium]|nr:DUF427 domain-containing protein [Chloroflexota bacterium]
MAKATWNGVLLADSDQTIIVEGNHYFPPDSLNMQFFRASPSHTICPWKGVASYFTLEVDGKSNKDAAWFYADPSEAAAQIKGYIAFWRGVEVTK